MADTMKVRFRVAVDGFKKGDELRLEESEALRYIDGKCAVPVRDQGVETADAPPPEKAAIDWDLKMDPEEYLERYPDGKHAEDARLIVEGA